MPRLARELWNRTELARILRIKERIVVQYLRNSVNERKRCAPKLQLDELDLGFRQGKGVGFGLVPTMWT